MIKITLALLVLSTVTPLLLEKKHAKKEESCSDSSSKSNSGKNNKACAQVAELKKNIAANEKALKDFIQKNKQEKEALQKKLEAAQKQCAAKHSHKADKAKKIKALIGAQRQLGKTVQQEEECEDESSSKENNNEEEECEEEEQSHHSHKDNGKHNGHKKHQEEEEECEEEEQSNHKNNKNKSSNAWGQKSINNTKASGSSKGQSFGNGSSQSFAGPQGSHSLANGTKGTKTASNFKSDSKEVVDAWAVNNKNGKSSAWGNKAINEQKVDAKGAAQTFGKGNSGTKTGLDGSQAFGNGSKGTKSGASWDGQADNFGDSWGVSAKKK